MKYCHQGEGGQVGVASGPGNFSWEIGNYAFNKKVHNRNFFGMKTLFKILQKWRKTGFVYVIAREGVKFGINFTSCSENGNKIARAQPSAILPSSNERNLSQNFIPDVMLSQINTLASLIKVKTSDLQTHFHNE